MFYYSSHLFVLSKHISQGSCFRFIVWLSLNLFSADLACGNFCFFLLLLLLEPKPVQIVVPYVLYSNAVVLFVRMPDIGVFDGIYVTSKRGPNETFVLKSDGKIIIENLTAGTEYDFCISTKSGKMLSSFYHVSGVKTCEYFKFISIKLHHIKF